MEKREIQMPAGWKSRLNGTYEKFFGNLWAVIMPNGMFKKDGCFFVIYDSESFTSFGNWRIVAKGHTKTLSKAITTVRKVVEQK